MYTAACHTVARDYRTVMLLALHSMFAFWQYLVGGVWGYTPCGLSNFFGFHEPTLSHPPPEKHNDCSWVPVSCHRINHVDD